MTERRLFLLITSALLGCTVLVALITVIVLMVFPARAFEDWNIALVVYGYGFLYVPGLSGGMYLGEWLKKQRRVSNWAESGEMLGPQWTALVVLSLILLALIGILSFHGVMHLVGWEQPY